MKRMNEVFELPVNSRDVYITSDLMELVEQPKDEVFIHAAHAINNVDALADALTACVKALGNMPAGEPVNDSDRAYHQALEALNAYRGAK